MKIQYNKRLVLFAFILLCIDTQIYSTTIDYDRYKLDLNEQSSRFKLFKKNTDGDFISVISASDVRTTTFSIYENNSFYKLGDSSRFKRSFQEDESGGTFHWSSKELFIVQKYILDVNGFLEIKFIITNISTSPKSVGMKLVLDTNYENEDFYYMKEQDAYKEIKKEYEVSDPSGNFFWTSGVRNSSGASIMGIPSTSIPSRIVFANWELLNNADYDYESVNNREFNNPPYSINDSAVMYLYDPEDLLPQNSIQISYLFRAISSVNSFNEIIFEKRKVIERPENLSNRAPHNISNEQIIIKKTVLEGTDLPAKMDDKTELFASENTKEKQISEKLETLSDIQGIIESISRPGILVESDLVQLESLINNLEEIDKNENKQ